MKAITILEPWASLIPLGQKNIETRSWGTKYRGPIAIHAAKSIKAWHLNLAWEEPFYSALAPQHNMIDGKPSIHYHRGCIIGVAYLVDCPLMTAEKIAEWRDIYGPNEIAFGHFEPGRYGWILANARPIEPVPVKGRLGLWEWNGDLKYV